MLKYTPSTEIPGQMMFSNKPFIMLEIVTPLTKDYIQYNGIRYRVKKNQDKS